MSKLPTFSQVFDKKLPRGFYIEQCKFRKKDQARFERIWQNVKDDYIEPFDNFDKKAKQLLKKVEKQGDAFLRNRFDIRYVNDDVGFGAFATKDIPKDTILGEYVGIIKYLSPAEDQQYADTNGYLFEFSEVEELDNFVIDAKTYGNFIRYLNHAKKNSKKENVMAHLLLDHDRPHVFYVSKGIKKGEEARLDYGEETYWFNKKPAK